MGENPPMISVHGHLSQESLPEAIRNLSTGRKNGVLHLLKGGVSKRIYFQKGSIVWASSDSREDDFGEFLIRAGRIKRSELELVSRIVKETGHDLRKSVVEMGFIPTQELSALAADWIKSIVYPLFSWESAEYRFEESVVHLDKEQVVTLSNAELILEGVRRIQDPAIIRRGLGETKAVLHLPGAPPLLHEEIRLTSQESLVLELARSRQGESFTVAGLAAISPLGEEETLRCLYALASVGLLEIGSSRAPAASRELASSRAEMTRLSAGAAGRKEARPPAGQGRAFRPSLSQPSVPQTVGRYLVQRLIGRGSMGAVLLARDPEIDRPVAIKLIQTSAQLSDDQLKQYEERFYREAKAAGRLLHPGIVTVFDVGRAEEIPFIVMEYVEGRTLQEVLETEGLELEEALRIACEILDALAYAHSQGVIHRDIKPANILITSDRRVKIMDFGIAHVVGSELTQASDILGTPFYMAPEQLAKGKVDPRTDLFAFGVVLYLMVTGKRPFGGDSFATIAHAVLFEEPVPPERIDPAISPALGRIVMRCLAKDPARRFAGAEEAKRALLSLPRAGAFLTDSEIGLQPEPSRGAKLIRTGRSWALILVAGLLEASTELVRYLAPAAHSLAKVLTALLWRASSGLLRYVAVRSWAIVIVVLLTLALSLYLFIRQKGTSEDPTLSTAAGTAQLEAVEPVSGREQKLRDVEEKLRTGEEETSEEEAVVEEEESAGSSGLLQKVADQLWKQMLPLSFEAQHKHRLGYCTGKLALQDWGVEYSSEDHGVWRWTFDQIRTMQRTSRWNLTIETHEKEVLVNRPKRYNFTLLDAPLEREDWARYKKIAS